MDLSNFCDEIKNKRPKFIKDQNLTLDLKNFIPIKKDNKLNLYLPWFLKYQLKEYKDLIKTDEVKQIITFLLNKEFKKGLLLYGTPGSGKTTTITLIAKYLEYELFEMNASDTRNKKSINEMISDIVNQKSLFSKRKIILIDEADGLSGTKDRGGISAITKFIKENKKIPFCFTANNIEAPVLKSLLKKVEIINFENHSEKLLFAIGKNILTKEKITFDEEKLRDFIKNRNMSDIRSFINDLQGSVMDGKFLFFKDLYMRNYKKKLNNLIFTILSKEPIKALETYFNSDINIDDLFLSLEENLPKYLSNEKRVFVFEQISKADLFKGRIMNWQYWRFLVYISFYLTYGVSVSQSIKSSKPNNFVLLEEDFQIQKNTRILKKWIYNNKYLILKERTKLQKKKKEDLTFIEKISKIYGCSTKKFRHEILEYFLLVYRTDNSFQKQINLSLELNEKEINQLLKI